MAQEATKWGAGIMGRKSTLSHARNDYSTYLFSMTLLGVVLQQGDWPVQLEWWGVHPGQRFYSNPNELFIIIFKQSFIAILTSSQWRGEWMQSHRSPSLFRWLEGMPSGAQTSPPQPHGHCVLVIKMGSQSNTLYYTELVSITLSQCALLNCETRAPITTSRPRPVAQWNIEINSPVAHVPQFGE